MVKVVKLPVATSEGADSYADADTELRRRLFEWADAVLQKLDLDKAVRAAKSIEELRRVRLDVDSVEVALAIRDALHPTSGHRQEHFRGLKEGTLKRILENRFNDLKKDRENILRRKKPAEAAWEAKLILDKDDRIVANLANLILILKEAPDWKGVLGYDEFAARVVIRKRPPWEEQAVDTVWTDTVWTDHHESLARVWFQEHEINARAEDAGRAVQAAARANSFHPVRSYFDALVWDGRPRLETWLIDYLHAEDTPYIRAIGPRFPISVVARVYKPGCQVDHMPVLEGPQGKLKSSLLRILAINDAWFTDRLSHLATKDSAIETAGVLLIEIAEMDALTKAASSTAKSFISRRYDRYRPPHGKHTISRPRQNVFAGTVNPPADGRYLKDPTGARRIWPFRCHGMIDCKGFEQVRDQLWAEAVHLFKMGMPWWLETPELEALATAEQAARLVVDAWEEPVREWVGDRNDISMWEVLEHALGLAPEHWTQPVQKRVVGILTRMGFTKRRPRTPEGVREHRYQRDPIAKKLSE